MNDSSDYMPNAQDNLSNLSELNKSTEQSEIDIDEINDVLLKNLESDVFHMQNEMKQKDHEMQKLLQELQERYYEEKDSEFAQVTEAYEHRIRELLEKNEELQEVAKHEREQNAKCSAVIKTLENENEKLRDDNRRQLEEIFTLSDKMQKMVHENHNRSTANSSGSSPNVTSGRRDIADDGSLSDTDLDTAGLMKANDILLHTKDEAWMNKFEFLREKLVNEQNKNRELEFMIATQKSIIESANDNLLKLKQDNKDLEKQIEKQTLQIDNLTQTMIIEKTKTDSVITFCELMETCAFPQAELIEKLCELPLIIASYLRGQSETILFNRELSAHSKLFCSAKKIKAIIEQAEENVDKGEKNYRAGLVASELDDIRHGITNLTEFLSKALPTKEKPRDTTENIQMRNRASSLAGPNKNYNNVKSSTLLAKAVQNSSSLLWNFKQTHVRGTSEERL